ncbi:MAG TPA: DUF711 family protein [Ktedonobacteraceae bacterium]|nr:DUF711 family protein [Ktedonobacteraceae bacterium]
MSFPPVRTITLGLADPHPLSFESIRYAADTLSKASARYADVGYEVQTVRLSTRPVLNDLADWSPDALLRYAQELQRMLDDAGLSFCSLGPAQAARPDFPLNRIDLIADMLAATNAINMTVQLATPDHAPRREVALHSARVMKRLANETPEGFGNFRFAALACVASGCPFFPTAYHDGPTSLTLGTQCVGIVADAIQSLRQDSNQPLDLAAASECIQHALVEHLTPVVKMGQQYAAEQHITFGGIDLSPAPLGDDSIAGALEMCDYGHIGAPGTVAVAAALTHALKHTNLPTCGYCGIMLPVLEDAILGKRWQEGLLHTHQLLLYSAVCGTGLDTIPLPGNTKEEEIAYLLLDVATLAKRLNKPLSARLFPVPGKQAGEPTTFTSSYLTNTVVR